MPPQSSSFWVVAIAVLSLTGAVAYRAGSLAQKTQPQAPAPVPSLASEASPQVAATPGAPETPAPATSPAPLAGAETPSVTEAQLTPTPPQSTVSPTPAPTPSATAAAGSFKVENYQNQAAAAPAPLGPPGFDGDVTHAIALTPEQAQQAIKQVQEQSAKIKAAEDQAQKALESTIEE